MPDTKVNKNYTERELDIMKYTVATMMPALIVRFPGDSTPQVVDKAAYIAEAVVAKFRNYEARDRTDWDKKADEHEPTDNT